MTIPENLYGQESPNYSYSIANNFKGCTNLKSILFEEGRTGIPAGMLINMPQIEEVTLPDSLESIGEHAFQGCSNMRLSSMPDGITYIGSYAFEGCSALTGDVIPASLEKFSDGGNTFANCTSITSLTIPKNFGGVNGEDNKIQFRRMH